jgi:hypothetical protein
MNFRVLFSAIFAVALLSTTGCSNEGLPAETPQTASVPHERTLNDDCHDGVTPTSLDATSEYSSVESGGGISERNIVVKGNVGSNANLHASGGSASTYITGNVGDTATVRTSGGGAATFINGDIGNNAVVVTEGGGACLTVNGSVGENAIVIASGGDSLVSISGNIAQSAKICSIGSMQLFVNGKQHSDGVINASHDIVDMQDCDKLLKRLEDEWVTLSTKK